ncbi:eukaryotic translation initiation factor 5B-like isoform X2 [Drosophila nasuta]|uniref:eukaryotic translation initiation factor 5B-like isoform X2 n=1 Tax=Drosophila nasuta TaxID=42062 RepID=UPI00295E997E|nr:eukaryotic translation initiation factor 5B-like isoform X2 [Drosophila nasuta]
MGREIKKIFANKPKSGKSSSTVNNEEDVKKNKAKKVRAEPALVDKKSTLTEAKLRKLKVDNEAVGKVTKLKNKLKSKTVGLEKAEMKDLMTSDLIAASEEQPRATKLKNKKAKGNPNPESESVLGDPKIKANQTSSVEDILKESQKTHKVKKDKNKPKTDCESNDSNSSSAANMEGLPKKKPIEDEAKLRKLKVDNDAVGNITKSKNKLKSKTVGLEKAEIKDLITIDLIAAASEEQPRATKLKVKKTNSKVNAESESVLGDLKIKANQTSSVADILEESRKTHKVKKSKTKLIAESYLGDPKIETEAASPVEIPKLQAKKPKFMAGSDSNDSNFKSPSSAVNMEGLPKQKPIKDKLTEAKLRKLTVDNNSVGKVTKEKNKLKSKAVGLEKAEMKDLITTDLIAAASEEQPRATKLKIKKAKGKPNAESESVLGDPKNKANQTSSVADILEESQKTHKVDKAKNKTKTDCESNDSNSSAAANMEGLPKNKPIKDKLTEAKLRKLKVDNNSVGKVTKSKNKLKSKTVGLEKAEMKDLMTSDLIAAASEEQPRATKLKVKKTNSKVNAKSESVLGDPKIKEEPTSSVSNVLEESRKTHKVKNAKNKPKTKCDSNDSNSSSAANVEGLPKNPSLEDMTIKDQSASKASAEADIMEESLPKSEPRELRVAKKAKNKKKSSTASDVNKKIETGNKASPSTSNRPEGGLVTFCYTCRVCKSHLFRSRYILLSPDFIFD